MEKNHSKSTIGQIAEQVGVSSATVSRVFNHPGTVRGEVCARVLAAAESLGYYKTVQLPQSRQKALLVMYLPEISNPFYHEIVKGAKVAASQYNGELLINEGIIDRSNVREVIDLLKNIRCRGLITLNYLELDIVKILSSEFPMVQCCEFEADSPVSTVGIDDRAAAFKVMNHLFSLGKSKIGFVNGPLNYKYARHRREAYGKAMEKRSLAVKPHWIVQLPAINAEMTFSSVAKMMAMPDPPDALFATSDLCAAAIIRAMLYCGYRVPEDVCVVGFDNIDISGITIPSLTTVNQPKFQIGYTAWELLWAKVENPQSENQHITLETELIIRESTAL